MEPSSNGRSLSGRILLKLTLRPGDREKIGKPWNHEMTKQRGWQTLHLQHQRPNTSKSKKNSNHQATLFRLILWCDCRQKSKSHACRYGQPGSSNLCKEGNNRTLLRATLVSTLRILGVPGWLQLEAKRVLLWATYGSTLGILAGLCCRQLEAKRVLLWATFGWPLPHKEDFWLAKVFENEATLRAWESDNDWHGNASSEYYLCRELFLAMFLDMNQFKSIWLDKS